MNNELLAVVDANDQVIGNQARHIIHASGLRHRAVHILVFNHRQQCFLQKRSLTKDINPGLWDTSAAGHVDAGESYDHCAMREIGEELGIDVVETLEFLFKLPARELTGMEFIQVYRCCHNGPFLLQAEEIDDGQWLSEFDISARVCANDATLTNSFKTLWRHFQAFD